MSTHWSLSTLIFYLALAGLGCFCFRRTNLYSGKTLLFDKYVFIWFFIWTFVASFRMVTNKIGGTDTPNYIMFFEYCNNDIYWGWMNHAAADLIFKWINKIVRYISDDYHVYFIVIYSFMSLAYIYFLKRFSPKNTNYAPYVLTFFLFLRSFSSIRSNLAIAFISLALILLCEKRYRSAYVLAIASAFVHKSSALYALVVPFCHIFLRRDLSKKVVIALIIGSSLFATTVQSLFITTFADVDLNGAYASYASRSLGTSFFDNAWKIAFEQMLLGLFCFLNSKKIFNEMKKEEIGLEIKCIWLVCMFDLILIPMNYILSIWRSYEYFYLARIVMWGVILRIMLRNKTRFSRTLITAVVLVLFVAWMIFRINKTWEDTHLMPYVLDLLY